jgi:dTDP-4-amino-4,6-dideoxygalactose transaminase
VIVTHLYGRLADVGALSEVARTRGIALIEDCAQAHGAQRDGRRAGSFGALGCFSFYPTKNLGALGDAGAVVTNDRDLAARLRALRTYGWGAKYHCTMAGGMNSRMDEVQAAVLRVKLPRLDAWNRRRREIAARYASAVAHPAITLPPPAAGEDDVVHLYVVRTSGRDSLRAHLLDAGVATDVHYPVPDYRQLGDDTASTPLLRTEQACAEVLSLPCYPELTDAEVDAVAAVCNRWQPAIRS